MNNKALDLIVILLIALVVITGVAVLRITRGPLTLGSTDFNRIDSGVTNASTSVGNVSKEVLAAGLVTSYAKLTNLGPTAVYCYVGATATPSSGIAILPAISSTVLSFHVFDDTNLPVQAVNCIAANVNSSTLTIYAK